jgi:hypothetical protein
VWHSTLTFCFDVVEISYFISLEIEMTNDSRHSEMAPASSAEYFVIVTVCVDHASR